MNTLGVFSQVVDSRRYGLFSEWICTFVSLQRCKRELEHLFLLLSLRAKTFR